MDQDIQTQNYRPGSQIDMTARLTSYQRSLTVAWGTSIYFRDQICRGKASAKRFQPPKRQKVVKSYWTDNLFSIFWGFQEHHLRVCQLDDFSFIRRICPGNWQCAILFGKCEIAPQHQRSVVGREKQNCCIPGKFIVIPKHTYRERRDGTSEQLNRGIAPWLQRLALRSLFAPSHLAIGSAKTVVRFCSFPHASEFICSTIPEHAKSKISNSAHIWFSSVHEKIVGLFPMPISHAISTAFWHIAWWLPSSNSVRTSPGSLAAWSLDRYRGVAGGWRSPRVRAVFARSRALRPKRIPRRGRFAMESPGSRHPVVFLGRCKGWKAQHVKDDGTFAGMCPKLWNGDEWWRMKKQSGINDWRPHHIDPIWSNHIQS